VGGCADAPALVALSTPPTLTCGDHGARKALAGELRGVRLALDALSVRALDSLAELKQLARGWLSVGVA
jgi:hypothetical protein